MTNKSCIFPIVEDMLCDPIVRLIMRSDGVDAREVRALCLRVRQRLAHDHAMRCAA